MKKFLLFLLPFISGIPLSAEFIPAKNAFPFNAYSMSEDSLISAAFLNEPITEKNRIVVQGEHLYANGKRLRIFGTNLSSFPSKENARFAAENLAAQGYNCIRFHHTDADWTNCFLKKSPSGKWIINNEQLDAFDYFFAELKKVGIYSNINLLTGRAMSSADGFHKDIDKSRDMKGPHSLGFWYKPARDYQQNYAKELLTHVNPYTGLSYCDDPAVAIVEINNENGFLQSYLSGWIEDYTDTVFWEELEVQWNKWLLDNNYSLQKLTSTYNKSAAKGETLITSDKQGYLEQHNGAKANLTLENGVHTIKITKNGQSNWHIQYGISGLNISSDKTYTVKFSAKASKDCNISVAVSQAHDPWHNAGLDKTINLSKQYTDFEIPLSGLMTDNNLRLIFSSMGFLEGTTINIKDVTLYEGGNLILIKEGFKAGNVEFPSKSKFTGLPLEYKNLILNFIWEKEYDYWLSMKNYLNKELNCKALLMGTSMGCSTTCIQDLFDIIDSHAYWNHPLFPVNSWDNSNYYVYNKTLTKGKNDATLTNLAKYRVYGKPFSVSEYDHPYPNQFTSEAYPMVSSFGSFQDWDCIFTFCSELPKPAEIKNIHTAGYFDQSRNPTKACAAPFAARIFRNFMIEPAKNTVYITLDEKTERANLVKFSGWSLGNPEVFGSTPELAKLCKIGIALNGNIPKNAVKCNDSNFTKEQLASNQIYWNADKGIYAVANDSVSITILAPGTSSSEIPKEFIQKGYLPAFKSSGDFAVFTAIKENNRSIIFSCRWTGNKNEKLKEYGKKSSTSTLSISRDLTNLTTVPIYQTSLSMVLNSEGSLPNPSKLSLFSIDVSGRKNKKLSDAAELYFSTADQTIWYILE